MSYVLSPVSCVLCPMSYVILCPMSLRPMFYVLCPMCYDSRYSLSSSSSTCKSWIASTAWANYIGPSLPELRAPLSRRCGAKRRDGYLIIKAHDVVVVLVPPHMDCINQHMTATRSHKLSQINDSFCFFLGDSYRPVSATSQIYLLYVYFIHHGETSQGGFEGVPSGPPFEARRTTSF